MPSPKAARCRYPLRAPVAAALLGVLCATASAAASIFAGYNAALHDRFLPGTNTPNPSFLLAGHDLTGISVDPTPGTFDARGAALISPQHILVASHFRPGTVFFLGGDGVVRSYGVSSFTRLDTTYTDADGNTFTEPGDVAIGTLSAAIPASHGVTPLPIVQARNPGDLAGLVLYAVGQDNQAGRNVIDGVTLVASEDVNGNPTSPTWVTAYDFDTQQNGGTGGVGDDEIGLIGGDSSYPSLLIANGQLALLGAHFTIDAQVPPALDVYYSSYSSLASPYLEQIEDVAALTGHSVSTLAVPEPARAAAAAVLGLAVLRRRRHSAAA